MFYLNDGLCESAVGVIGFVTFVLRLPPDSVVPFPFFVPLCENTHTKPYVLRLNNP